MKDKPQPGTPEFLTDVRNALEYLPEQGVLQELDGSERPGFHIPIQGRKYPPERIAWLLQTGQWTESIGFRNGIEEDLRWSNLFDATAQQEVTVVRSGDLFVLRNGDEQVIVSQDLDEVLRIAGDVLRGGPVAPMKERQ